MNDKLPYAGLLLGIDLTWGCATEPNVAELQKQVQNIGLQQEKLQQQENQTRDRLAAIESQLDEHDFLVGELIKTEEEATLDTRHLLEKLERTSSMLRDQIEQTRVSTKRRDRDLSIRAKALEARIDNIVHQPRARASNITAPKPSAPRPNHRDPQLPRSTQASPPPQDARVENEASAFRFAYKVFLKGNYDRASIEFQRFVKHYPSTTLTPQALYYLGQSYYVQQQYDPAKQALEHMVSTYPNNKYRIQALNKLGHIMLETNHPSKAQELWNQVIQEYPTSSEANYAKEQLKKAGLS